MTNYNFIKENLNVADISDSIMNKYYDLNVAVNEMLNTGNKENLLKAIRGIQWTLVSGEVNFNYYFNQIEKLETTEELENMAKKLLRSAMRGCGVVNSKLGA